MDKRTYLAFPVLIFAGIVVYISSFGAPFYLDDNGNIINKDSVRMAELSVDGMTTVLKDSRIMSRPVANLSFALNYYFFGYDASRFRAVNLAIHILTSILLLQFLRQTFRTPALRGKYPDAPWLAFGAALLWLVHPVQTQAVTYIVQRMASMSAMFYMAAMVCYAAGRLHRSLCCRLAFFSACFFSAILALGSKETAVTLPAFIILYEWFFFQDLGGQFFKRVVPSLVGVVFLSVLLVFLWDRNFIGDFILDGYAARKFTLVQRLLTEPRVIMYYLGLLLFPLPSRLSLEHDFALSTSLFSPPSTTASILLLALIVVLICMYARRFRLASFIVCWFLGNLLLESTILPLELVFEHRLYLPSMLLFLFVPLALARLAGHGWVSNTLLALLVFGTGIWTFQRNAVWADPLAFHRHNLERAPGNYRSHYNLGHYYLSKGQFAQAIPLFSRALAMEPRYTDGHKDLGFSYLMTGRYDEALLEYQQALAATPDDPKIYYYLGIVQQRQGKPDRAIALFSDTLRLDPDHVRAHTKLGDLYAAKGEFAKAARHLSRVVALGGEKNFRVLVNLGNCYANMRSYERAIEYYTRALRLNPEHEQVRHNLELAGRRLERQKKEEKK